MFLDLSEIVEEAKSEYSNVEVLDTNGSPNNKCRKEDAQSKGQKSNPYDARPLRDLANKMEKLEGEANVMKKIVEI